MDAILSQRGRQNEHEAQREIKNEFMAMWDGIRASSGAADQRILVLGATNRPYDLDEAVLRRFPRRIFCDLPTLSARQQILEVCASRAVEPGWLRGRGCWQDVGGGVSERMQGQLLGFRALPDGCLVVSWVWECGPSCAALLCRGTREPGPPLSASRLGLEVLEHVLLLRECGMVCGVRAGAG